MKIILILVTGLVLVFFSLGSICSSPSSSSASITELSSADMSEICDDFSQTYCDRFIECGAFSDDEEDAEESQSDCESLAKSICANYLSPVEFAKKAGITVPECALTLTELDINNCINAFGAVSCETITGADSEQAFLDALPECKEIVECIKEEVKGVTIHISLSECSTDEDCDSESEGKKCREGFCGCNEDADCPEGLYCLMEYCIEFIVKDFCSSDPDCLNSEYGHKCMDGLCGCSTDSDCQSGHTCHEEQNECSTNAIETDCSSDNDCVDNDFGFKCLEDWGFCGCEDNSDCLDGFICEDEECWEPDCASNDDCIGDYSGSICKDGWCGCNVDADCPEDSQCFEDGYCDEEWVDE